MNTKINRLKSQESLGTLINNYWADMRNSKESGKLVAWSSVIGPTDLLTAMDINVVFPENYGATCGAKQVSTEFCEKAEAFDYSPEICSYARNGLGPVLSGDWSKCPVGGLPKPDILIPSSYCSPVIKWFEAVSKAYDVPLLLIDLPFIHDDMAQDDIDRAVKYMRTQMDDMIAIIEKLTGRKFDYDKLQQNVEITGEMGKLWTEILNLTRHKPAPTSCFDMFVNLFPVTCMRGNIEGVNYYKQLKAELTDRIEHGVSYIPNEKYRLYWDNLPIWYKMRDLSNEFASYDANIVTAMYPFCFCFSYDAPDPMGSLDSIAEVLTLGINNRSVQQRSDFITQLVKDYSIDGLIMQNTRTCKYMCLGQPDIMEVVERETGVQGVVLEADMCDSRQYSEAQIKLRIQAFMELLANKN